MDIKAIWSALVASALFNTVLGFVLKDWLAKRFEAKAAIQLESVKNTLSSELERAKHTLQLEQSRLSIVYENQRTSFTNVIRGMDIAIHTLEETWDWGDESLSTINESTVDTFQRLIAGESLYTGSEGDRALRLFADVMSETTGNPDNNGYIPGTELRWSLYQMRFIFRSTQEYFRFRIGLSPDHPLLDLVRLGACRLLNQVKTGIATPDSSLIFKWVDYSTVEELISVCRDNPEELIKAIESFVGDLGRKETRRSFFFTYLDEARRYKEELELALMQERR